MSDLSTEQTFALIQETQTSVFLVQEGLLGLNRLSGANDFYHGPMELLAQGFERLMKVVICLGQWEGQGTLPTPKEMKKKHGHDLVKLADTILELYDKTNYATSRPAAMNDRDFIATDERLRELLSLLADFGNRGRYYDLDTFLDPSVGTDVSSRDPMGSFQKIERDFLDTKPEWMARMGKPEFQGFYEVFNAELTATLQRFARALSRFFTLGPLGAQGRRLQPAICMFLFLRDEELATVPRRRHES